MRAPAKQSLITGTLACLALLAYPILCEAATSTAWEVTGFDSFSKGKLSGLLLTPDGVLQPGPSLKFKTDIGQPALWSVVRGPDGSIYAATGHSGKVYRISPDGKTNQFWTAEQAEVFALCAASDGHIYAATSPNGGLYRLENGKATELWHSPVKYIWAVQPAPDGSFYVGTGDHGQVYQVDVNGKSKVLFETGQGNVTALALGPNGNLYAGTDPNGLLYEITAEKQGGMLFDSSLPEIRSIIPGPGGVIYAAAMGGAVATRTTSGSTPTASTPSAVVAANPTVITVTEANRGATAKNVDEEQSGVKASPDTSKGQSSTTSATPTNPAAVVEVAGVEKSAIYRIDADKTVETLRSSKDENVYDLLLDGDTLVFSTDNRGRLYRLVGSRATLLADEADGEMTRVLKLGPVLYGGLSNPARLVALNPEGMGQGQYESQVHDSVSVARWGHLQWRGGKTGLLFRTRTGNSARPDSTWSAWSPPMAADGGDTLIQSPPARFIQWRAEWKAGSTAEISGVTIPYLPRNGRPQVRTVTVTSVLGTNAAKSATGAAGSSSAYSVTVTDTGDASASSGSSASTQTVSRLQGTQTQVSWQADDPDGDKLSYSLYFRAEDAKEWQLIRSRMAENTLLLDPDVFADGRYFFRVVATDLPANAPDYAQNSELVSSPVLIDNTPPIVTLGSPRRSGMELDLDVEASDRTSPLRVCEYSLNAGPWQPIEAKDGVTDSPHESFHVHLDKLKPGEHLLVVRVYDTPGNAGLARVVLR